MPLRELVADLGVRLTETDRRVMNVLLANPQETAFLSTNEVAQRAEVHPASAVRFARKLGFDGYPGLRARLQMKLFGVSEAAERMRHRIEHLGTGSVLKTFVDSEIMKLGALVEQIPDEDILAAARTIARAPQCFLFAVGHAAVLTRLLETRLGRLGYPTHILAHVGRDMAASLLQTQPRDAFVLFALNAVHPLIPRLIEHARAAGAASILISDRVGATVHPAPDIVLAASRGAEGEPRSLAVPMTICNVLVLHVSRLDPQKSIDTLKRLDALRQKLGAD